MAGESSWLDQGTRFLGGIAEVYGTYEKSRANDLEYQNYDAVQAKKKAAPAVPGWLLIGGAVLGVVVLLRLVR